MVYHFYADDTQIYFFASLGVRVQESSTKRVFSLFALVLFAFLLKICELWTFSYVTEVGGDFNDSSEHFLFFE